MQDLSLACRKAGFWKIEKACEQAKGEGLRYAWVDPCCIDKSSSAELQEAINSMFEWYAHATECYAYLSDVRREGHNVEERKESLKSSRWFSRGWTLQELIAPSNIFFFDRNWNQLGSRSGLGSLIADRTRIDLHLMKDGPLFDSNPGARERIGERSTNRWLGRYSIAQRMSWAADRETTRVEDRAYSLLGIFGIVMPLLYGEGRRSFTRLQEEIIRANRSPHPDLSILLWEKPNKRDLDRGRGDDFQTLLATSPDAYFSCGNIGFYTTPDTLETSTDLTISSIGMKVQARVVPLYVNDLEKADFAAILNCYDQTDITTTIGLKLLSQKSRTFGGPEYSSTSETLHAFPYSISDITEHSAQRRTIHLDAIRVEQESISKDLFLARETSSYENSVGWFMPQKHPFPESLVRPPNLPDLIWVRLNSVGALEPPSSVSCAYPRDSWNLDRLTFRSDGNRGNILRAPQIYFNNHWCDRFCVVSAIALQRPDVVMSRVVVSVACTVTESGYPSMSTSGGSVFFRVDAVDSDEDLGPEALHKYCTRLLEDDVPLEDTGKLYDTKFPRLTHAKLGPGAKGIQLYDGTKVYDGAVFAIQQQLRSFVGKPVVVLQVVNLQSMSEFELEGSAGGGLLDPEISWS